MPGGTFSLDYEDQLYMLLSRCQQLHLNDNFCVAQISPVATLSHNPILL